MATNPLAEELAYYRAHRDELLKTCANKFVLIQNVTVIGSYDLEKDAFDAGYAQFGNTPFLVKQVTENETVLNFTSFTVAY